MQLYLDDVRFPPNNQFILARSSAEALDVVKKLGWPTFMSLDHDLGGQDTTMVFLRQLVAALWDGVSAPPQYSVHSANPVGKANIVSFMESWKKSLTLKE
jgi:hypothetical protein